MGPKTGGFHIYAVINTERLWSLTEKCYTHRIYLEVYFHAKPPRRSLWANSLLR